MSMTFGYWNIRGTGSSIRNLLRHVGAQYTNVNVQFDQPPNIRESWLKVKFTLGFDFPNLPYLIDGDLKLTQSLAILKYLGRKYDLAAKTDPDIAKEEMVLLQISDMLYRFVNTSFYKKYNSDDELEAELVQLRKELSVYLDLLENFIKQDQQWFTGDKLSYVDFFAYEIIDWYRETVQKDCLEKYPKLSATVNRFEQLENLKDFLASDEYRKAPLVAPVGKIGGTKR